MYQLNRAVVHLKGKDCQKLLQGLTTNNVLTLAPNAIQYTSFLNGKGRILCDAFLLHTLEGFSLDVHSSKSAEMVDHLTKYKLRNQVSIELTDGRVYQHLDTKAHLADGFLPDPRHEGMGHRFITLDSRAYPHSISNTPYDLRRLELCIPQYPESILDLGLPLEHCIDKMNGIDFKKGCYLGQELTVRTHHTGVVRKRVVGFLFGEDKVGNIQEEVLFEGKKVGAVYERIGKIGLGMMKLEHCDKSLTLHDGSSVVAKVPNWWI